MFDAFREFFKTMNQMNTCLDKNVSKSKISDGFEYSKGFRKIRVVYDNKTDARKSPRISRDSKGFVVRVPDKKVMDYMAIESCVEKGLGLK